MVAYTNKEVKSYSPCDSVIWLPAGWNAFYIQQLCIPFVSYSIFVDQFLKNISLQFDFGVNRERHNC